MRTTPEEIAAQLTPPQRVFLFCIASGTDWKKQKIEGPTVQLAVMKNLVHRREPCGDRPRPRSARCAPPKRAAMTQSPSGARYAIVVDGTVRTHRDMREAAFEAANVLKALRPYTKVVIRDLQTGAEIDPQKPLK